jgi:hypothetical protein
MTPSEATSSEVDLESGHAEPEGRRDAARGWSQQHKGRSATGTEPPHGARVRHDNGPDSRDPPSRRPLESCTARDEQDEARAEQDPPSEPARAYRACIQAEQPQHPTDRRARWHRTGEDAPPRSRLNEGERPGKAAGKGDAQGRCGDAEGSTDRRDAPGRARAEHDRDRQDNHRHH